jgi:hypothetical protein
MGFVFFKVFFVGGLAALDMFISLSHGRKRNEPKRKAAGCISDFLHASPKRPELY